MIHFAIVGCGHIANKHIEAIAMTEGAKLAALCDTNIARLSELKERNNVPVFSNMTDMLEQELPIDVVCICTPSGLHTGLAVEAANAGKHLVIEKPMALTLDDVDAITQAVRRNGVKATVVHPNRYRPAIRYLQDALSRDAFGKLSHVNVAVRWNRGQAYYDQASWRGTHAMDGGVLMNQAIHSLDLLIWLFGPVAEIKSFVDTRIRDIEAEDTAVAVLRFSNGILGIVEATTTIYEQNLEETISVFGENGYAVIGGRTANWIKQWKSASITEEEINRVIQEVDLDPFGVSGHQRIIENLVHAIQEGIEPDITLEDGREAVKLVVDIVSKGKAELYC
ncbi:Gfo/Idh/MocA family protein [Paenibacillus segetis]|uniref:Oxidoreductase n=1 Tax=Paenibacillus segetis TaxID=1325360 RepID=A0ABQ1YN72_9BACL|nr:Gfo/Idh/MocA family oxidoreductase [Paenibacillus segetis]GGH32165.1 oxidoreductase [Paenibacillus segetis]